MGKRCLRQLAVIFGLLAEASALKDYLGLFYRSYEGPEWNSALSWPEGSMISTFGMIQLRGMSRSMFGVRSLHVSGRTLAEKSHYERLKLPFDATTAEIKNKFKKMSLRLHPDILKSQGLSDAELDAKSDEYLKVKKSYEVLADEKKRGDYDLHMGIRRREGSSSPNSFFKRPGNSFHFHEQYRYNDVPHFDSKKHQERNERIEKRFRYQQKVNQNIDTFGRDLYARNLGDHGPRKGIYREYTYQPDIREDESEGKKIAIKLASGVIGVFLFWYVLCGNYNTGKQTSGKERENEKRIADSREREAKVEAEAAADAAAAAAAAAKSVEKKHEEVNTTSKSGNNMSVNNAYGLMLIGGNSKRDDMEVFEEQTSEAAE